MSERPVYAALYLIPKTLCSLDQVLKALSIFIFFNLVKENIKHMYALLLLIIYADFEVGVQGGG